MTFWKDKVVLVTGGHGFVGTHVVQMLKNLEGTVVHNPSKYDYNLTVEREVDLMFKHLRPEVVIHLAGKVGGIAANKSEPGTFFMII